MNSRVSGKLSYKENFQIFKKRLKEINNTTAAKKYLYINIWSIGCPPCIKEMPFLNLLALTFPKKIGCVFISPQSEQAVSNFLLQKEISLPNWSFINGVPEFIQVIFEKIEEKTHIYPSHIIINANGIPIAYLFGSISDEASAAPLVNFINSLD